MKNYRFHPGAEEELNSSVSYYESRETGLGIAFAEEVRATIENILCFPSGWPLIAEDVRRCQTRRFPYAVLYTIEADGIYVLALMHLHRSPGYWQHRKTNN